MSKRLTDAQVRRAQSEWSSGQTILREPGGYMAVIGSRGVALSVQTKSGRRKLADWDGSNVDATRLAAERAHLDGFSGPTLGEAWQAYKKDLERRNKSAVTIRNYADLVERVMKPLLDVRLADLAEDNRRFRELFQRLGDERKLHLADNMVRALSAVWAFAKDEWRELPDTRGPLRGVRMYKPAAKKKTIDDLPAWNTIRLNLPSPLRREMHLFALLSGLRRGDLLTMRWENLNVANRAFLVPTPKGGQSFRLPLSRPMLACLARARREGDFINGERSEWVWPSPSSSTGHVTENKENGRSDFAYGHVLRKTYATVAYGVVGNDLVARMLNHAPVGVTESRYIDFDALHAGYVKAQEEISKEILLRTI